MTDKRKKIFNDTILIFCLLLFALSVFFAVRLTQRAGAFALVKVDGKTVMTLSLSDNGEYSVNGGTNTVVVEDGTAYMKDASCPDRLCVSQGKKHRSGERIICLPNRVEIEILAEEERIH